MAKKFKALKQWSKKDGQKMAGFALNTYTKMGQNSKFAGAGTEGGGGGVLPATMKSSADDLNAKYLNKKNGPIAKGLYVTSLKTMEALLQTQVDFVNFIANGDSDIILSSGFLCSSGVIVKAVIPDTPKPSVITIDGDGSISITNVKVEGADTYCIVVFIGAITKVVVHKNGIQFPDGGNVFVITTGSLHEQITGLTPGVQVSVTTLAQNAAGKSPFNVILSKYVS